MDVEQRLRSTLQDGARSLHVPEAGPGAARARARQRARRVQALAVLPVLAVLAGVATLWAGVLDGTPEVVLDGGDATAVDDPPRTLDLRWEDAESLLGRAREVFRGSDGTYYAVSTAPGTRFEDHPDGAVPQALYRSGDGFTWEVVPLGEDPWIADLGERDGLLYALSTAPGMAGGTGQVAVSADSGQTWQRTDLPPVAAPPEASVPVELGQTTGHLAVGEGMIVAALRTTYVVDTTSLLPAGEAGPHFWASTPEGLELFSAALITEHREAARTPRVNTEDVVQDEPVPDEVVFDQQEPLHTVTWEEMGLAGPGDLTVESVFVSADGTRWEAVPSPFDGRSVTTLAATPDGFVAALTDWQGAGGSSVTLLRSADGIAWEPVAGDGVLAAAGPLGSLGTVDGRRLVAVPLGDGTRLDVLTSDDGGTTWHGEDLLPLLPEEAGTHASVVASASGALGTALGVMTFSPDGERTEPYLLASADGRAWSVASLADVTGGMDVAEIGWLTVDADAVAVGVVERQAAEDGSARTRTFVGTPAR